MKKLNKYSFDSLWDIRNFCNKQIKNVHKSLIDPLTAKNDCMKEELIDATETIVYVRNLINSMLRDRCDKKE